MEAARASAIRRSEAQPLWVFHEKALSEDDPEVRIRIGICSSFDAKEQA
jgi:hypothetical protein